MDLNGELESFAPLLSLAGLTSTGLQGGRLHAVGSIDRGVAAAGSELRAEAAAVDLRDAAGAVAGFPAGLTLSVEAGAAHRLRFTLKVPKLVLGSSRHSGERDRLSGVLVGFDGGDADLAAPRPVARALDWKAEEAVFHSGASTLTAATRGTLKIVAVPLDAAGIVVDSGEAEASDVLMTGPAFTSRATFGIRVALSSGQVTRDGGLVLGGRVEASGPDADALLGLFGAAPAVRLALGSVEGQPFTLNGTITRRPGRLALESLRLESNGVSVDGAYYRRDDSQRAAFVVAYGRLSLGVSIVDGADQVAFAPADDWLAARTREAAGLLGP